jgi:Zn-dependent protease
MVPGNSIRLFRISGIDVFVHWSWFLVAAFELTSRQNAYASPLWNVFEYLALFFIVLLHEFGHSFACRQVGGEAERIMLWPLGGVASVKPPQRPGAMLWSIAAGPLVNVALVFVLLGANAAGTALNLWEITPNAREFLRALSLTNAGLLVFNLLPIYPLDGGQILRSLLWFLMGRARSLMVAATLGFVGVAGVAALAIWSRTGWFALIGAFIAINCWTGWRASRTLMQLEKTPRHDGYRCPECHAQPPQAKLWRCNKCGAGFDTFQAHAACPTCGMQFGSTTCVECGVASPFNAWAVASNPESPMSLNFDSQNIKPLAEPLYNLSAC